MSSEKNLILEIKNLKKQYSIQKFMRPKKSFYALRGIDMQVKRGEILALVGESGCGKSTLAKCILGIESDFEGEILFEGKPIQDYSRKELSQKVQMIFQDPHSSLNPRKTIMQSLMEPLQIQNQLSQKEIAEKIKSIAKDVALSEEQLSKYPHMLSGGQKQRVVIARALSTDPSLLICDEPVSALDLSIQAQVINLLMDLQAKHNLSLLFISHDLNVVRFLSERVSVMYLGRIVEEGVREEIFRKPLHPYSQLLIKSVPDSKWQEIEEGGSADGEIPSPLNPPSGCHFRTRCPIAKPICAEQDPMVKADPADPAHWGRCPFI